MVACQLTQKCLILSLYIFINNWCCLFQIICPVLILTIIKVKKLNKISSPKMSKKSPKRIKNLVNGAKTSLEDNDDSSVETDDDVSLCKFGLNSFTDSSNDTSPFNSSLISGRACTPRSTGSNIWNKPRLNSTFCMASPPPKSQSVFSENIFLKPTFNKYQKLIKDDSESDLDESISCLNIGSPKKRTPMSKSIFSLRKFTPTPSFVTPTVAPLSRPRPVISPSKLSLNTSWVAGGYWGSDGNRENFNVNGSRSSSQSSGFESQTSSNQRYLLSQPPSREESIYSELEKMEPMKQFNLFSNTQNFSQVNAPVFPQMKYDNHVFIPQPRFNHGMQSSNVFIDNNNYSQQRNVPGHSLFKTPHVSGLIKLPQSNTFSSH